MTSSTWNCEARGPGFGVGVDAERIARFVRPDRSCNPLPMVFTEREVRHADASADPPRALCAAFCVKEALFKAAGVPFDPLGCEVFACGDGGPPDVVVDPSKAGELAGRGIDVRLFEEGGDLLAAVLLWGGADSPSPGGIEG